VKLTPVTHTFARAKSKKRRREEKLSKPLVSYSLLRLTSVMTGQLRRMVARSISDNKENAPSRSISTTELNDWLLDIDLMKAS
jgi:hypothetical protein